MARKIMGITRIGFYRNEKASAAFERTLASIECLKREGYPLLILFNENPFSRLHTICKQRGLLILGEFSR